MENKDKDAHVVLSPDEFSQINGGGDKTMAFL